MVLGLPAYMHSGYFRILGRGLGLARFILRLQVAFGVSVVHYAITLRDSHVLRRAHSSGHSISLWP